MTPIEQAISKYTKYRDNIKWHIDTNKPEGEELRNCTVRYNDFNELIKDLKSLAGYAEGQGGNGGKLIEAIKNMSEDKGREGCTWGDTEYDSLSVAYGYNTCLLQIQEMIGKSESPTTLPLTQEQAHYSEGEVVICSNVRDKTGISLQWLRVWEQVERWYGDVKKEETGEQFLKRLQATYFTTPSPEEEAIDPDELWDEYSEHIDDDISSLERVAGGSVIMKHDFNKMMAKYKLIRK